MGAPATRSSAPPRPPCPKARIGRTSPAKPAPLTNSQAAGVASVHAAPPDRRPRGSGCGSRRGSQLRPVVSSSTVATVVGARRRHRLDRPPPGHAHDSFAWSRALRLTGGEPLCPANSVRLADLVPPPRKHRHRYHGVLAPNHTLRPVVTALPNAGGRAPMLKKKRHRVFPMPLFSRPSQPVTQPSPDTPPDSRSPSTRPQKAPDRTRRSRLPAKHAQRPRHSASRRLD
jgi:hypothetical protein